MKGVVIQGFDVREFHNLSQIHHPYPMADISDDRQVMGNKKVGQIQLFLEPDHQIQYLGTDGHVESGNRFIPDDQAGPQNQSPGDTDPLPLPSGKFMGKPAHMFRKHSDRFQSLSHPFPPFGGTDCLVVQNGFLDDPLDGHPGIQGSERVLEYDLHVPATLAQLIR
jgi:hypothetical protein